MKLDQLLDHYIGRDSELNINLGTSAFQDMSSIFTQQSSMIMEVNNVVPVTPPNKPNSEISKLLPGNLKRETAIEMVGKNGGALQKNLPSNSAVQVKVL